MEARGTAPAARVESLRSDPPRNKRDGLSASAAIPFNLPSLEGRELAHIRAAIDGGHISGSGAFSATVSARLAEAHDAADVLLTTSCTDALEMSAMMLDLLPGQTVIVPSFTFVSTALAFVREGVRVVFADIEGETLGLDPEHVRSLLDDSVRAVVPVHYAGVGCDLAGLEEVLASHPQVDLVEDNAHGLFGRYRDKALGSFGRFSTLSFHETKNFVCGEGGALIVNRAEDVGRAHVLHDKGTNRQAFRLGSVDKYSWVDTGSSFALSEMLAAYLLGQLEASDAIMKKRRLAFEGYEAMLAPDSEALGYRTPIVPPDREQAYHMFYVLLADNATRDRVLEDLRAKGVTATFHYVPLHSSAGGRRFGVAPDDCPVTDDVSGRLLRLPFYNSITTDQQERVAAAFLESVRKA
jgi:dTDP-4-amino-4,6-dideoxygalactose transaminase